MLPGSLLFAWRMAIAHLSPPRPAGEKVHVTARATDIMMAAYGILFTPAIFFIAIATET